MMKRLLVLLLTLVMIFTMVACGSNSGSQSASTSSSGSATPAGSAAMNGDANQNDKPYAGTTLNVVVCTSSFIDCLRENLPEFEAETGIKVNIMQMQDAQVSNKVSVSCSAGSSDIDVFGYRPLQESVLYIDNGWLEPLNKYIENSPEFDYEDFFESARELNSKDGTVYGIPYMTEREIVYLNMDLLKAAGYTKGPSTFDELIEMCEKLTDPAKGIYGLTIRGEGNAAVTQFSGFLYGFGGDFITDGKATINTPEAIKALQFYGKLVREYCPPGSMNYGWVETMNVFTQGIAAMRIDADSQYAYAVDPESSLIADSVSYSVFPAGPAGSKPFNINAWALGINSYSKNKDASWEFIKWAVGKEQDVRGQKAGNSSARYSTWNNEEAVGAYPDDLLEVIVATNPIGVSHDRPVMKESGEARQLIGELITAAIQGVSDEKLQALADKANARIQELLDAE